MTRLDSSPRTPPAVVAFRVAYGFLTLNFLIPATSYLLTPEVAIAQLDALNQTLGGRPYVAHESVGHLWHMLAVGNVMTLGFMCALLLADLRRFYPVLPALTFLKGFSALSALRLGIAFDMPAFMAVFALDGITTAAIVFFAMRAHRAMASLVPSPRPSPYFWLLLWRPDRIQRRLDQIREAGIVRAPPNLWQIFLGVLYMWSRLLHRTDTVGTSSRPVRRTWRARLLAHRALRLPVLIAGRYVAPLDFSGLAAAPERIIRHLLGAHHDGAQCVYDLELLSLHSGALEALRDELRAVVAGRSRRARWLQDLVVFEGYHLELLERVEAVLAGAPIVTEAEATDPDLSLRGYLSWCARQPASPAETWAALRRGQLTFARPARNPTTL